MIVFTLETKAKKSVFFGLEILNFEIFKKAAFNIRSPLRTWNNSLFLKRLVKPHAGLWFGKLAHMGFFSLRQWGFDIMKGRFWRKFCLFWNFFLKTFFWKPSKTRKADASFPGQLAEDFSRHIVTLLRGLILEILSFWKLSRVNLGLCWLWEGA